MKSLRNFLDKQHKLFEKGGKLEKFYAAYEMVDTILYTPGEVTKESTHVRDSLDLKRMMITVVVALIPCIFFAMYNTGLQANLALSDLETTATRCLAFTLVDFQQHSRTVGLAQLVRIISLTTA